MQDSLPLARIAWALGFLILTLTVRAALRFHHQRRMVKGLPGPPHSYLWGSLKSMNEVMVHQPKTAAPQTYGQCIRDYYNLGDYFVLDVYPFNTNPLLMIFNTEMMHEMAVKHSLPKHDAVKEFMVNFGGPGNLVSSEGSEWKRWRSCFNPGFSTAHLMSLVPVIVDQCEIFSRQMDKHARSNDLFRFEVAATKLTVDIIGKVVLDLELGSQKGPNELVDAFIAQTKWQPIGAQFNPWELVDFRRPFVQRYLTWKMNRYIGARLDERFATRDRRGKSKAVIDLALDSFLKEVKGTTGDGKNVQRLDPEFKQAAISNMKTFVFAGHDTTSSTISYVYYYLSKNPKCLERIRAEHDAVFGTDISTVSSQLKNDARLLNQLEYTLAVTREVLRLQPPASTIRIGEPGFFLHDPVTGDPVPTEGFLIWPLDVGLHRNSKYWPDPSAFIPERHLANGIPDGLAGKDSREAWVAFSKGPRNCIGQELALIETKVILAMTIRSFDFTPAYNELSKLKGDGSGYTCDEKGVQTQFGEEAYQIQLGTAKSREGMPCRIKLRS